jgi:hypothetical protein
VYGPCGHSFGAGWPLPTWAGWPPYMGQMATPSGVRSHLARAQNASWLPEKLEVGE